MRVIMVMLTMMLAGCASFGPPTLQESVADMHACSESWACRTFIEDRPLVLVSAIREDPLETRCALSSVGIGGYQHGPFVIASVDGRQYAIGHSWTCNGICSKVEAMHSFKEVSDD